MVFCKGLKLWKINFFFWVIESGLYYAEQEYHNWPVTNLNKHIGWAQETEEGQEEENKENKEPDSDQSSGCECAKFREVNVPPIIVNERNKNLK